MTQQSVQPTAPLSDLCSGREGVILGIRGENRLKRRLAEMGFVKGARVSAGQTAPLGDPRTYTIRGYQISLRRAEADQILIAAADSQAATPAE
ncbi:MAG: ferrous iron transport protein A [Magnetococcales bacterium]|nr:ferrous iron transport protein A [Magnetococcales bacterium]